MASEISKSLVVESIPSAINEVWEVIYSKLRGSDFSQEDIFGVHLALEEAFINAVKHGNKMNPNKEVKIGYSVDQDKIEIFMMDEGDGFDPDSVPDPRLGENVFKIDGRGLFLMRSFMDVVEHNNPGNSVHMVRYKGKHSN